MTMDGDAPVRRAQPWTTRAHCRAAGRRRHRAAEPPPPPPTRPPRRLRPARSAARRDRRHRSGGIPFPPLRSRRGLFIVLVLVAGFGSMVDRRSASSPISWTETADFCGRCHTMGPELKAYEMSPHREVACAECHVEPGVGGWVKAKINGTRQLIERPDRDSSRSRSRRPTTPTCRPPATPASAATTAQAARRRTAVRSSSSSGHVRGGRAEHAEHGRARAPARRASAARPAARGVHWHIDSRSGLRPSDPRAQTIDSVEHHASRTATDEQFIAANAGHRLGTTSSPTSTGSRRPGRVRRMDCIDCHNRVGHGIPSPGPGDRHSMAARHASTRACPTSSSEAVRRLSIARTPRSRTRTRRSTGCAASTRRSTRWSPSSRRRDRRGDHGAQADLPPGRDAGDEGDRRRRTRTTWATSRRPAASAATTAPTSRSSNGAVTQRDDPVRLRDLPHLPADRGRRVRRAHRQAAGHRTTTGSGSSTTRTASTALDPGGDDLRCLPHPHVLRGLPQHAGRQGHPRRHGLQPRRA